MEKYSNCTQYYSLKMKTDNTNDPVTEQYPAGKHQVLTFMWMWLQHVPHVLQQCCWACTIPSMTKATLSSGKLSQQDTTLHPQRPKTAARRIQIFCWQCPRARQHRTPSESLSMTQICHTMLGRWLYYCSWVLWYTSKRLQYQYCCALSLNSVYLNLLCLKTTQAYVSALRSSPCPSCMPHHKVRETIILFSAEFVNLLTYK